MCCPTTMPDSRTTTRSAASSGLTGLMMHPATFWQKIANVARKLKGPWPLAPTAKAQSSFLATVRPPISCTKDL